MTTHSDAHPDALRVDRLDPDKSWQQRYHDSLMGVFGTPQELLIHGEGCWVTDAEGRRLLDMLGGIAVNALGHAHPKLVEGLTQQLNTLGHVSNLFTSVPQMRLAEMILNAAEAPVGSKVFLANSGSEANEGALKAVLHHRRRTGKSRILALEGGFHGRTAGALALTHKPAFREPFGELISGIEFVPADDLPALESALDDDVAGLFLEPIQGEAGVHPLGDDYLLRARQLTREHGALLILDEVQTGVGRTGEWFRHQAVAGDVQPDYMTLAKGLGSGIPIGALVAFGELNGARLAVGQHGATFGGNPLAALAGQITLETIQSEGLLDNARRVGERIAVGLNGFEVVAAVRQYGLHIGVDLDPEAFSNEAPAKKLVSTARQKQDLIINATGEHTLRLAPPLTLTEPEAETFLTRFAAAIEETP